MQSKIKFKTLQLLILDRARLVVVFLLLKSLDPIFWRDPLFTNYRSKSLTVLRCDSTIKNTNLNLLFE